MKKNKFTIRTLQDIRLAREKCRYEILQKEVALSDSMRDLKTDFRESLRNSMIRYGGLLAGSAAARFIQSRSNRKK